MIGTILLTTLWTEIWGDVSGQQCVQPFRPIFTHPDPCVLNLSIYGIDSNIKRAGTVVGDYAIKLYYSYLGYYPNMNGITPVNGGIPQNVSENHYNKTRTDLMKTGNSSFTSLVVIDYESWRPIYSTNFGTLMIYQNKSKEWVLMKNVTYSNLAQEAESQFEAAARTFFLKTIKVAKDVMPNAHHCYYLFPRTWGSDNNTKNINDKMDWLWKKSTCLTPTIYYIDNGESFFRGTLKETNRVQATFSPPNTPIYPFTKIQRNDSYYHTESDLDLAIGLPAKMGCDGVVIWGSSSWYQTPKTACPRLQNYINQVLGPYVKKLIDLLNTCNTQVCSCHGRCIHKDYAELIPNIPSSNYPGLNAANSTCSLATEQFKNYTCRCQKNWTGACCDIYHS